MQFVYLLSSYSSVTSMLKWVNFVTLLYLKALLSLISMTISWKWIDEMMYLSLLYANYQKTGINLTFLSIQKYRVKDEKIENVLKIWYVLVRLKDVSANNSPNKKKTESWQRLQVKWISMQQICGSIGGEREWMW